MDPSENGGSQVNKKKEAFPVSFEEQQVRIRIAGIGSLGGGFNLFNMFTLIWTDDQIWQACFSNGVFNHQL